MLRCVALPLRNGSLRTLLHSSPSRVFASYSPAVAAKHKSMTRGYTTKRQIGYSQQQLYELVADISHYQGFLPWCKGSKVLRTTPTGCLAQLEVGLELGFMSITEKYLSNVTLRSPSYILAESKDTNLFDRLVYEWHFEPIQHPQGPATIVHINVDFKFANPYYEAVARTGFDSIVHRMVIAFEKQALQLYGRGSFPSFALHA